MTGSFLNFLTLQLDGKKDILYVKHTFYLQIFFTGTSAGIIIPFCALTLLGWAPGRAFGFKKLSDEVLVWLSVWSKVQIVCIWSW